MQENFRKTQGEKMENQTEAQENPSISHVWNSMLVNGAVVHNNNNVGRQKRKKREEESGKSGNVAALAHRSHHEKALPRIRPAPGPNGKKHLRDDNDDVGPQERTTTTSVYTPELSSVGHLHASIDPQQRPSSSPCPCPCARSVGRGRCHQSPPATSVGQRSTT